MSDKLCIDLCSGLGGFSAAFRDAGWEVVTVDNEAKFNPTICKDVRKLRVKDIWAVTKKDWFLDSSHDYLSYHKTVILASPPCERFSLAANGRGNTRWPGKGIRTALEIVGACFELISELQPDGWVVENPKARLRWFIGKPTVEVFYQNYGDRRMKPTDIWTNLTLPLLEMAKHKKIDWMSIPGYKEADSFQRQKIRHRTWSQLTRNPAKRAEVPYGLSQAILEAVESDAAAGRGPA